MFEAGLPVSLVLVDRQCRAEQVAGDHGVRSVRIERGDFGPGFERELYTGLVIDALVNADVDLVAMAGFGTVLGAAAFDAFPGRILNTHPALLPAFKGWHAVRDALAAGVDVTGCTVHVATVDVDDGPILAQESVAVVEGDDEATLHERIKAVERRLYIDTIAAVIRDPDLLKGTAR